MNVDEMKKLKSKVDHCNDWITTQNAKLEMLKEQQNKLMGKLEEMGFKTVEGAECFVKESVKLAEEFVAKIEEMEKELQEQLEGLDD